MLLMRTSNAHGANGKMQERVKLRKRAVNLSIDAALIDEAKAAGTNLSALLEQALTEELREVRLERTRAEHRPAIEAYNRFVAENGLLSDEWRKF
jgi:antitoxin CcdA